MTEDVQFSNKGLDYHTLNASVNLYGVDGGLQLDKDREAARQYHLTHINPNTQYFHDLTERLEYLKAEGYYEAEVFDAYSFEFVTELRDHLFSFKYRFKSYLGAVKFYSQYALKTFDGKRFLERFEDRVLANALFLGNGNETDAWAIGSAIMTGYQPATPTFANAGKRARGGFTSCFLIRTEDSLESITRTMSDTMQLAKRGGGVGILGTNIREAGAPIKGIANAASGPVPFGKVLDNSLAWINQLGSRQGAGVLYTSCHHPDVLALLDTKRENADDMVRLKILSIGLMMTDKAYELSRLGEDMYLFSPYDVQRAYGVPMSDVDIDDEYDSMVANPDIRKTKISARELFKRIIETQAESGYPYLINEKTANRANPIHGRINMSNLCVEVMQVNSPSTFNVDGSFNEVGRDISCNLGSLLVNGTVRSGDVGALVDSAVRALTTVTLRAEFEAVPSVEKANESYHSIGLGNMGLHGFLAEEGIGYDSPEALDFADAYFSTINFHTLNASNRIARERGESFFEFEKSTYASGEYFDQYMKNDYTPRTKTVAKMLQKYRFRVPTPTDWHGLQLRIQRDGLFHSYRLCNAPTGSISYVRDQTSSIHPITSLVEMRSEGKTGTVYYPAQGLTNENKDSYKDAYQIGYKPLIDLYARAQKHVDQSQSMTLFFSADSTSKDMLGAIQYAWRQGVKSVYYVRIQTTSQFSEMDALECVSCSI